MKHQWLAYLIVALLSIGAGVAIAGLPDNVPADATIIPPTTTEAPGSHGADDHGGAHHRAGDHRAGDHRAGDDRAGDHRAGDDRAGDDRLGGRATSPTAAKSAVVAANGANVAGAASNVATQLEELGYVDIAAAQRHDIVEFTVVYYADGFEDAALRLAEDLALLPEFVAPIEDAPAVADLPADVELLVYIGRDRA